MAVDWDKLHLIDAINFDQTEEGFTYFADYWLDIADIGVVPVIGDTHPGTPGDAFFIETVSPLSNSGCSYILSVTSVISLGTNDNNSGIGVELKDVHVLSSTSTRFEMSQEIYGLKEIKGNADKKIMQDFISNQVASGNPVGLVKNGQYLPNTLDFEKLTIQGIKGAYVKWGEWAEIIPSKCPFKLLPDPEFLGQTFSVPIYTMKFYELVADFPDREKLEFGWKGSNNGAISSIAQPFYDLVPSASTPGRWLARDYSVNNVVDPLTGFEYYEIIRRMQRTPPVNAIVRDGTWYKIAPGIDDNVVWDPFRNGGEMEWIT